MRVAVSSTEVSQAAAIDPCDSAVTPDEAASSLIEYIDKKLTIDSTGEYWAPRGPR